MTTKRLVIIIAVLGFATLASQARAAMTIMGYQPNKHDRFYTGTDRDFIGEAYDWSGVGWSSDSDWGTMISPQYFLCANHAAPDYGSTITFYEDDDLEKLNPHTYTVDNWSQNSGDICLRRLTEPLNPSDNITYYPILDFSHYDKEIIGMPIFTYGVADRVGRNEIDSIKYNQSYGGVNTDCMIYDYEIPPEGLGDDESWVEPGDSGAPSFIVYDGGLVVAGIHWLKFDGTYSGSGDSFVLRYSDTIIGWQAAAGADILTQEITPIGGDANLDGIVDDIDATILAVNWGRIGSNWLQGDFNHDQKTDSIDALIMSRNWLRSAETSPASTAVSAVPEPSIAVLFLLGWLFIAATNFRCRG